MLMLNLLVTCSIRDSQECANTTLFSYVDNWLAVGSIRNSVLATADSVIAASHKWAFKLNPGKAWASATLKADRAALQAYSFEGHSAKVPVSCTELGMNLHFDKRVHFYEAEIRASQTFIRLDRLRSYSWPYTRKVSIIQRGIFPFLFSSCETQYFSKSFITRLRGKCNLAVGKRAKAQHAAHFLGSILIHKLNYEPMLYLFRRRLSSLISMILLPRFGLSIESTWHRMAHLNLLSKPTKIHGPVALFLWTLYLACASKPLMGWSRSISSTPL